VSLCGAKLQTKSCVPCGKKEREKQLRYIPSIFTTGDTGEHRGGNCGSGQRVIPAAVHFILLRLPPSLKSLSPKCLLRDLRVLRVTLVLINTKDTKDTKGTNTISGAESKAMGDRSRDKLCASVCSKNLGQGT